MGMFDDVNVEIDCPKCGSTLNHFQSKDGNCELEKIDPENVLSFYDFCTVCKLHVSFDRRVSKTPCRNTPYTLAEVEEMGFKIDTKERG